MGRFVNIKRQTKYSPPAQEILSFTSSFLPAKQPPTSVQAHHHNHGRQPEPGRAHHSVLQRHWRLARRDPKRQNMNPYHNSFTPTRSSKSECLPPNFTLVLAHFLNLLALLLLSPLDIFVVSGCPFHLSALMLELCTMLLECCDCKENEFIILGNFVSRPGDDHWRQSLVALQEVFLGIVWDNNEVGFDVFGLVNK